MVLSHTTNFVDRLLMKLDGAIAPIWNRFFLTIEQKIDEPILLRCFQQLIQETPRLRSIWNKQAQHWEEQPYSVIQSMIKLSYDINIFSSETRIKQLLANQESLEKGLPIRLNYGAVLDDNQYAFLITFELHHGAGDGYSATLIMKRFWQILEHMLHSNTLPQTEISQPELTDKLIIKQILKQPHQILKLAKSENRQLARRGSPLKHQADHIGMPTLLSFKVKNKLLATQKASSLFYTAILAAIIQLEDPQDNKRIRFRIPVDVRQYFNLSPTSMGNACSAIIIEFALHEMRALLYANSQDMISAIKTKLKQQLKSHLYIANAFECLLVSKLSTKAKMHQAAPKELLGDKRSCSLVITFMGEVDHYITPPSPINLLNARSHTPVWGLNGFLLNGYMHINISCFDGIWPQEIQEQFKQYIINFFTKDSIIEGVEA